MDSDEEFFSGEEFETPQTSPVKEKFPENILMNNVLMGIEENAAKEAMRQSQRDALSSLGVKKLLAYG